MPSSFPLKFGFYEDSRKVLRLKRSRLDFLPLANLKFRRCDIRKLKVWFFREVQKKLTIEVHPAQYETRRVWVDSRFGGYYDYVDVQVSQAVTRVESVNESRVRVMGELKKRLSLIGR